MATNGYKNRDKDIGWIKETADQYGKYNEKATDGFRDKVPNYTNDFNTSS